MGHHGLGCINDNGDRFADLYAFINLVIGGNIFIHKAIHKPHGSLLIVEHPTKLIISRLQESGGEA